MFLRRPGLGPVNIFPILCRDAGRGAGRRSAVRVKKKRGGLESPPGGQTVPLRPFCHKVYLPVDLLFSPFGAHLVRTVVAVRQTPRQVASPGRALPAPAIDESENGPAVTPGELLVISG